MGAKPSKNNPPPQNVVTKAIQDTKKAFEDSKKQVTKFGKDGVINLNLAQDFSKFGEGIIGVGKSLEKSALIEAQTFEKGFLSVGKSLERSALAGAQTLERGLGEFSTNLGVFANQVGTAFQSFEGDVLSFGQDVLGVVEDLAEGIINMEQALVMLLKMLVKLGQFVIEKMIPFGIKLVEYSPLFIGAWSINYALGVLRERGDEYDVDDGIIKIAALLVSGMISWYSWEMYDELQTDVFAQIE